MQQCSAPCATKAAPPSSRINSLESLCGTLKSCGIFLLTIKSLLTRWHEGTATQSRTGIFSWNTPGVTACAGTQSPQPSADGISQDQMLQKVQTPGISAGERAQAAAPWGRRASQAPAHLQLHLLSHGAWGSISTEVLHFCRPRFEAQSKSWDEPALHNVQRAT